MHNKQKKKKIQTHTDTIPLTKSNDSLFYPKDHSHLIQGFLFLILSFAVGLIALGVHAYENAAPATSFEECKKRDGSRILELYPPVCITKEGDNFTKTQKNINTIPTNQKDSNSQTEDQNPATQPLTQNEAEIKVKLLPEVGSTLITQNSYIQTSESEDETQWIISLITRKDGKEETLYTYTVHKNTGVVQPYNSN